MKLTIDGTVAGKLMRYANDGETASQTVERLLKGVGRGKYAREALDVARERIKALERDASMLASQYEGVDPARAAYHRQTGRWPEEMG